MHFGEPILLSEIKDDNMRGLFHKIAIPINTKGYKESLGVALG